MEPPKQTTQTGHKNGGIGRGSIITFQERLASSGRMASDALDRLTVGPLSAFSTGVAVCFGIGVAEGYVHLRPVSIVPEATTGTTFQQQQQLPKGVGGNSTSQVFLARFYFAVRYGVAQILPSVIWGTQPSSTIATNIKFDPSQIFWSVDDLPPRRRLRVGNLVAMRGAVAGSILLSQVLSITNVLQESRKAYSDKIYAGQEPPLDCTYYKDDDHNNRTTTTSSSSSGATTSRNPKGGNGAGTNGGGPGVVIRLAGRESDVTFYGMVTMGRQRLWPVFEDPTLHSVRTMVQHHATSQRTDGRSRTMMNFFDSDWGGSQNSARVPVYWSVDSGRYSQPDSWRGMGAIPGSWLFDIQDDGSSSSTGVNQTKKKKMLILEADVTAGDGSLLSLSRKLTVDLDLDLREVSHGFRQIAQLVTVQKKHHAQDVSILKVVLVDPDTPVESGGGRVSTAGKELQVLMEGDSIVINSRAAIVQAMVSFLEKVYDKHQDIHAAKPSTAATSTGRGWWFIGRGKTTMNSATSTDLRPVILETHSQAWFTSIRDELRQHGYNVLDRSDVVDHNSKQDGPLDLPVLVYERSSADTVDTIHAMVDMGVIRADRSCALLSDHRGLEAISKVGLPQGATYICSSEIYHRAFQFVRDLAISGTSLKEIQARTDAGEAWECGMIRSNSSRQHKGDTINN